MDLILDAANDKNISGIIFMDKCFAFDRIEHKIWTVQLSQQCKRVNPVIPFRQMDTDQDQEPNKAPESSWVTKVHLKEVW